jgi:putative membrane protein
VIARAFLLYGLGCVVVAGIWGAATVSKKIFFIQALPAILALLAVFVVSTF